MKNAPPNLQPDAPRLPGAERDQGASVKDVRPGSIAHARRGRLIRRGFSIAEATVSIMIVSLMLIPALNAAVASRTGQQRTGDERRGHLLAEALMSEVLQQPYTDPNDAPLFGLEGTEGSTSRVDFDDVDDYDAWSASPPQYWDGTVLADLTGWRRSAVVEWVAPSDVTNVVGSDQGVKRITITVSRNGRVLATLVAVRTGATDAEVDPGPLRKLPILRM